MGGLLEEYQLLELIGEGSFGRVYLAEDRHDLSLVAIKIIPKDGLDSADIFRIQTEMHVLALLDHPNVIRMLDCEEAPTRFAIVLEYARGGELLDRVVERGRFSEAEAAEVIRVVMQAVCYCHAQGVIHRDLKPENLLYESREAGARIKVSDFGVSRLRTHPHENFTTLVGSASYQAPEILYAQPYDEKCDVYSMGAVFYTLLCGYPPFDDDTSSAPLPAQFPSPEWDSVSAEAKDLLASMLCLDPRERISAPHALEHPFFIGAVRQTASLPVLANLNAYTLMRKSKRGGSLGQQSPSSVA